MGVDFASLVREASQNVGAQAEQSSSSSEESSSSSSSSGIQIERHDAEQIRGQAKSGLK